MPERLEGGHPSLEKRKAKISGLVDENLAHHIALEARDFACRFIQEREILLKDLRGYNPSTKYKGRVEMHLVKVNALLQEYSGLLQQLDAEDDGHILPLEVSRRISTTCLDFVEVYFHKERVDIMTYQWSKDDYELGNPITFHARRKDLIRGHRQVVLGEHRIGASEETVAEISLKYSKSSVRSARQAARALELEIQDAQKIFQLGQENLAHKQELEKRKAGNAGYQASPTHTNSFLS